ncbi:MAG: T6SS immunity protein Tdi1 domain-containing protein [Mucilaginibacter sp.]
MVFLDDHTVPSNSVNENDILEHWDWLLGNKLKILIITKMGDVFLSENDGGVYWLATDVGSLTKVAEGCEDFKLQLEKKENFDNWFLPELVDALENTGKKLNSGELYSFINLPILGGEYEVENIEPCDISVHFTVTGQLQKQIKNLPGGTKIKINIT